MLDRGGINSLIRLIHTIVNEKFLHFSRGSGGTGTPPIPPEVMKNHPLDPDDGPHTGTLPEDEVVFDDGAGHDHAGAGNAGKKLTAANVINVPAGGIAAVDVHAALNELDTEKAGIADAETISADWTFQTDKKLYFRDVAIYIASLADGFLDIVADTAIRLTTPYVDIQGISARLRLSDNNAVNYTQTLAYIEFGFITGGWNRTGYIGFGSSNNDVLYISNEDGANIALMGANVGIGTTGPAEHLHVYHTGAGVSALLLETAGGGAGDDAILKLKSDTQEWWCGLVDAGGANLFSIFDFTAAAHRFLIDTAGYVGIGVVPEYILHVFSSTEFTSVTIQDDRDVPGTPSIYLLKSRLGDAADVGDNAGSIIGVFLNDAAVPGIAVAARIKCQVDAITEGTESGHLEFHTNNAGNDVERLRISKEGDTYPGGNKTQDFGLPGMAWDDAYADDWHNVADLYLLDRMDDLAVICGIRPSGDIDPRTGLLLIDDKSLPEWVFTKDKKGQEVLYDPDGRPYISVKMLASLSFGAIRQLTERFEELEARMPV